MPILLTILRKNGEDVNAALVASVSEDKKLPDEEEYIFDDKHWIILIKWTEHKGWQTKPY